MHRRMMTLFYETSLKIKEKYELKNRPFNHLEPVFPMDTMNNSFFNY